MNSTWVFRDLDEGGCEVAFDVDFEFKNRLLQGAAGLFFHEAMQRIVRAFEARAKVLYGRTRRGRRPGCPGQTSVSSSRSSAWATLALRTAARPRAPNSTVSV
jgi:hypothetical protein